MVYISINFLLAFYLLYSANCQVNRKACYVPARGATATVSNGEKVSDRLYPWHVAIFKTKGGSNRYICGGSIISKKFVLTAAHCLYEEKNVIIDERLFIRVGSNHRERGDYYGIHKKIINSEFKLKNLQADIALLQILNEIKYTRNIRPVCYTNVDFIYKNKDAWIPGWGLTENQAEGLSNELNHAKMPGRTSDDCEERNPAFYEEYVNDYNFCAGNLDTTSICTGDSGGGLVIKRKDGWYIRGIASLTPSAKSGNLSDVCDLTQFVVFTDVVEFADWIDNNILGNPSTIAPRMESTNSVRNSPSESAYSVEIPPSKPAYSVEIPPSRPAYSVEIPPSRPAYSVEIPASKPAYSVEIPPSEPAYSVRVPPRIAPREQSDLPKPNKPVY